MTIGAIPIVEKRTLDNQLRDGWYQQPQEKKDESPSNPEGLDFKKMLDEEVKTLSTNQ